jgi:twitching motility protein PilT
MNLTVENLLGQIETNHLMSQKDLEALRGRWFRAGRREVHDAPRFCDWLHVNDYLTEFVLSALSNGRADRLTLNQYRLTDVLPDGSQAGDFLATDPLDRVLHVQIVAPAAIKGPAWLEKFRQAVQRLIKVQHPGVARLLDLGHARGVEYLVSEYVEGESLEDVLRKRGKLNYEFAARVFALIFDALAALHQSGVPARELSASRVLFTSTGKATAAARTIRLVNVTFPRQLFDSLALGVIGPEQLPKSPAAERGEEFQLEAPPRPEEEIYRLGSVFYRSVTGQEPAAPGRKPVPVRTATPEVPAMLADLIDSMIDPVATNRPKSAAAVAKSLRVFLKTEEEEKQSRVEDRIAVPVQSPPPAAADVPGKEEAEALSVEKLSVPSADLSPDAAVGPEIERLFRAVMTHQGSDLHLAVGTPPMMRLRNVIRQMDMPPLTHEEMERLVTPLLTDRSRSLLDDTGGADFAYIVGQTEGRFRVSLFKQRGQFGLVARRVNSNIPTFEKLGLPPVMEKLCTYDQGLIILAGVTGSGKSTTLAAMIDYINEREQVHILTIEDPIEYLFTNKKAVINQREVGIDVVNWSIALKQAVRQDPDVILVGEMRDRDTFEAGMHAAETGHLVFGTIHASSAPSTIGRILDLFPADMHQAMRQSLAFNLKAIVCQKLLPSIKPGLQRVPTNEILIVNPTIRELIVKGEDKKLPDAVRIGLIEGMLDFNESLRQLVDRGDVAQEAALEASPNPDALKMALKGIRVAQPGIL